ESYGIRLQQSGLQHRRPESHQVRWRGEKRAGARETGVVWARPLPHAELGTHGRPRGVERREVRGVGAIAEGGALHAERLEYLAAYEHGKRLPGCGLDHCAEEDPAIRREAVPCARLE